MNDRTFPRRAANDHVFAVLDAAMSNAVGDHRAPDGAGWQGEPGTSDFVPYTVVHVTGGAIRAGDLNAADSLIEYQYVVYHYAADRQQLDWMSDTARDAVQSLRATSFTADNGDWVVMDRRISDYGGIELIREERPYLWMTTDSFILTYSRA